MSKENAARKHWAQSRINRSNQPFTESNLSEIGETDGVIIKHPDGKIAVTGVAMERFLMAHMARRRMRQTSNRGELIHLFASGGTDDDNADNSDKQHAETK